MARIFDDIFNEALYEKRRRQDNILVDNWIDECLFMIQKKKILREALFQLLVDGSTEIEKQDIIVFSKILQMSRCIMLIFFDGAYGVVADAVDDYVHIGESTTIECLEKYFVGIISVFENEYLRK
ncbi:uncharacterized protein LOC107633514 [Arachis ipaensis]|uniref:uncharacterized protein LOC107633514 n=1 Tax=Arachis ipaensis TaxID=130454 RepID=UPI0007AF3F5C|nr:uncharacterized protein LOC107633514 [Arachis ipaensis]